MIHSVLKLDKSKLAKFLHLLKRYEAFVNFRKKLYLIDEKGVKYPLKFDCKNCEMMVLSPDTL